MKKIIMCLVLAALLSTNSQGGIIATNLDASNLNGLGNGATLSTATSLTGLTPDIYFEGVNTAASVQVNAVDAAGSIVINDTVGTTFSGPFQSYYIDFRPNIGGAIEFDNAGVGFNTTFNAPILGVATSNGFGGSIASLNNSNVFGVAGVNYSTAAIDGSAEGAGNDIITISGNTLSINQLRIGNGNADNIRVFVGVPNAVPEPSGLAILSLTAIGFFARRRR